MGILITAPGQLEEPLVEMELIPSTERLKALKLDRGLSAEQLQEWQGDKILIGQPSIWRLKTASENALLVQLLCSFMPAHGHKILNSRFLANFELLGMPSGQCSVIDLYPRNIQQDHPTLDNTVWVMDTETGLKLITDRRFKNFLLQIDGLEVTPKIIGGGTGTGRGVWDFISLPSTSVQGCKVCYLILKLSRFDSLKIIFSAAATIETSFGLLPFTFKKDRVQDFECTIDVNNLPEAGRRPALSKEETSLVTNVKVLFLAANPPDTRRLRLDLEIREITEKIRASDFRDALEIISLWAVRPADLLQALNQHKPQIVHFSGHGHSSGGLVLEDSQGEAKPVGEDALRSLFRVLAGRIRVVVLNACFSETQAQVITEFVDCAIGTSHSINDQTASTFAAAFYRAIGFGASVYDAFEQGKAAVLLEGLEDSDVLQLRTRSGVDPSRIILTGHSSPSNASS